jgi:hypothetical protein
VTDILNARQQFSTPQAALAHYGVKGMQWGVRKADRLEGVSRKTNKQAADDAREFARAKMFYGEGAGTRRKLIKATIESRSKDPAYKKALDHHMAKQDLGKHAEKAKSERRRKDVKSSAGKTARSAHRQFTGGMGNVTLAGALLGGGLLAAHQAGIDRAVADAARTRYSDTASRARNRRAAASALRDMGL